MLPVLMILPQPCCSMKGTAALVVWKADERQTDMMSSHLSSGKSCTGLTYWVPVVHAHTPVCQYAVPVYACWLWCCKSSDCATGNKLGKEFSSKRK
eukprot:GHRR01037319.1.p1 GENE.GHRR01037319.1~~GHRR01037319.1.p1  ORF type:complete len:111 (+),score=19.92 GHRR01037319.1:48-335(+)